MTLGFLDLPIEVRLNVYDLVFGQTSAVMSAKRRADDNYPLLPVETTALHDISRASQLLRVCKTVLFEARPVLYRNTKFHIIAQAFAGRLPCTMTNAHPAAAHVQHLTWQLDCDILKHFYPEDLRINPAEFTQLQSLELRCRADLWRSSFMGEWCDREAFVKGRKQMLEYATILRDQMASGVHEKVLLVENQTQLDKGRVMLRLTRDQGEPLRDSEILLP